MPFCITNQLELFTYHDSGKAWGILTNFFTSNMISSSWAFLKDSIPSGSAFRQTAAYSSWSFIPIRPKKNCLSRFLYGKASLAIWLKFSLRGFTPTGIPALQFLNLGGVLGGGVSCRLQGLGLVGAGAWLGRGSQSSFPNLLSLSVSSVWGTCVTRGSES